MYIHTCSALYPMFPFCCFIRHWSAVLRGYADVLVYVHVAAGVRLVSQGTKSLLLGCFFSASLITQDQGATGSGLLV